MCVVALFPSVIERGDAEAEGLGAGGAEAALPQEVAHGAAGGELLNGAAEILVGVALAGEETGDAGHDVAQVEEVEAAGDSGLRQREIEDKEGAAGLQDAGHLSGGLLPGGHVPQAEGDGSDIHAAAADGEIHGIGDDEICQPTGGGPSEHGRGEVGSEDDGAGAAATDLGGEISATSGEIENEGRMLSGDEARGAPTPQDVYTKAEDVVGEDVAPGDLGEGTSYEPGVLAVTPRYVFSVAGLHRPSLML